MIIIIMLLILWKITTRKEGKHPKKQKRSRRYGKQRNDETITEDPMINIMAEILKDVDLPTHHIPHWEDQDEPDTSWKPWCTNVQLRPSRQDSQVSTGLLEIEMENTNDNDGHIYQNLGYTNPPMIGWH